MVMNPEISAPPVDAGPDVGRLITSDYPKRALPRVEGARLPHFQVIVKRSVLNGIHAHGKSSPNIEVCGVLVGNVFQDEQGPYLHVEASIRGEHAGNLAAQVTFTTDTWTYIHDQMEKHHADRSILGWYHTHPGFGIFLSAMDLFIQHNFFNLPWQVAHVYDPAANDEGMFIWRAGKPVRDPFLVEEDADDDKPQVTLVPAQGAPAAPPPPLAALVARLDHLERQHKRLLTLILLVALVAGFALGGAISLAAGVDWQALLTCPADAAGEQE